MLSGKFLASAELKMDKLLNKPKASAVGHNVPRLSFDLRLVELDKEFLQFQKAEEGHLYLSKEFSPHLEEYG